MNERYFEEVRREGQTVNPLFAFLGLRLVGAGEGEAEVRLPVKQSLTQGIGLVAGGILATMADEVMAHAAMTLLKEGQSLIACEVNIRFLRPADPARGGELAGKGKVVKPGRQIMTTEASVFDREGRLLATAGGSFLVRPG